MSAGEVKSRELEIVNKRGLHARASARFVQTAEAYSADVRVSRDGTTVGGTSIMGLMLLAASPGCTIFVEASGADADAVLDGLERLVAERFGEEE